MLSKWDYRFLSLAKLVSGWSKDKTKIGAVLTRQNKSIASTGFNGLCSGIDDEKWMKDRIVKNLIVIHAEENAISFCSDHSKEGYHMFIYGPLTPCSHCASIMIREGIASITCVQTPYEGDSWSKSTEIAINILDEAGIPVKVYSEEEYDNYREKI